MAVSTSGFINTSNPGPTSLSGFDAIVAALTPPTPSSDISHITGVYPGFGLAAYDAQNRRAETAQQLWSQIMEMMKDFRGGSSSSTISGSGDFGNLSDYMNLFNLSRERAHQGLQDQFTQAGGATSLEGPFTTASANLERGLGQTEQGSLVDLGSRLFAPKIAAQSQNLNSYLNFIKSFLG